MEEVAWGGEAPLGEAAPRAGEAEAPLAGEAAGAQGVLARWHRPGKKNELGGTAAWARELGIQVMMRQQSALARDLAAAVSGSSDPERIRAGRTSEGSGAQDETKDFGKTEEAAAAGGWRQRRPEGGGE